MSERVKAGDVARLAGVSKTTVSFVLNGRDQGNVAPATAERVRAAAAELGYVPDRLAQSMRLKRTHVVGLVTDAIASSPFAGRILAGAVDRAAESGYVLLLFDSHDHAEREQDAVAEMSRRRVDGLVYASMGLRRLEELPHTSLPLVLANCFDDEERCYAVIPDDEEAARAAAVHLAELGHRRVAMLTGPGEARRGNIAGPIRSRAFRRGARAAGLSTEQAPVLEAGWSIDDGFWAADRLLTDPAGQLLPAAERPTAVFAVTDRVATGVLLAAGRLGLRVPEDLSVLGFDDQEQLAANVVPALTTFALPHREMGVRAVDRLLGFLAGRTAAPVTERLTCTLVVRESTAPPSV